MTGTALAAVGLLLLGIVFGVGVAVILAIVILLLEVVRAVWTRNGLQGVHYRRALERDRVTWGEEIPATIEVWNRKRLPLAWLRAEDAASPGVVVRERSPVIGVDGGRVLRNAWTLAPFERVTRQFHVGGEKRGAYELGPVDLAVGDLFAREAATERREEVTRFLVRPRVVPTTAFHRRDRWGGVDRALAGLTEDPSRFAGVREYAPGDPVRRVHHRASARLGRPVVKVFEPSRDREVLILLDLQMKTGPLWDTLLDDDEVEGLFVVAASLARSLAAEHASVGLAAAGYHGAENRIAYVAPSEAPGQLERILDLLARLSEHPSTWFEELLAWVLRVVRPGTTVIVVSAREGAPWHGHLLRLEQMGCPVIFVACGRTAGAECARARAAGIAARTAGLDGPWRTATLLAVEGATRPAIQ